MGHNGIAAMPVSERMGWRIEEWKLPYTDITREPPIHVVWKETNDVFVMNYDQWCPFTDNQFDIVWARMQELGHDGVELSLSVGEIVCATVRGSLYGCGQAPINTNGVMHAIKTAIFRAALEASVGEIVCATVQ